MRKVSDIAVASHRDLRLPEYPGLIIDGRSVAPKVVIRSIQRQLVAKRYGPLRLSGMYDAPTRAAVRLFQAQHVDRSGQLLISTHY